MQKEGLEAVPAVEFAGVPVSDVVRKWEYFGL